MTVEDLVDMASNRSYYGNCVIDRSLPAKKGGRRKPVVLATAIAFILISMSVIFGLINHDSQYNSVPAHSLGQTTLALTLIDQHKDTGCACNGGNPPCIGVPVTPPHVPNDVKNMVPPGVGDNLYGTINDCPHCSAYCVPGSIAMIAKFRGIGIPFKQQDDIYDHGKKTMGETQANGIIETHGVGMTDGSGGSAWEVQDAFNWSIGAFIQHNQSDATALSAAQLEQYILFGHPVLWLDHNGWPANLSDTAFPDTYRQNQGHAKVIGGYNDSGTDGTTADDLCLIYDPWPEYNDMSILPLNATQGPGGTFDPYWLPLNDVNLSDIQDRYLVDTYPDIPEFSTLLIPIIGIIAIALVASRTGYRKPS